MSLQITHAGIFSQGSGADPPVISGFAFPGETLTSDQPGQWHVDGVPVGPSNVTTFAPRVQDVGLDITQENANGESNAMTCWHPRDVPQVKCCRVAWAAALNTVGPDVPATVGQTVRRWTDIVSGWHADQATGANQPILREANGMRYLEFDGVDDFLSSSNIAIANGDTALFALVSASSQVQSGHRPIINIDRGGILFSRVGRNSATFFVAFNTSYHPSTVRSLSYEPDPEILTSPFVGGFTAGSGSPAHQERLNGTTVNSNATAVSAISGLDTSVSYVGSINNGSVFSECSVFATIEGSGALTAANLSRLERFLMLCAGANYTGPDIPLVSP